MPAPRPSIIVALALLLGGCTSTSTASDGILRGRVVALSDGDTITVLDAGNNQHKIRLTGIDAPERKQPFGSRSTEHLSALVFRKDVEVEWAKRDRYGRILGKVMVAEPGCLESCPMIDANLAQVAAGMAWWYRQYAKDQPPVDRHAYEAAEARSREAKLGLWRDADPVPPWKWRRTVKGKGAKTKGTKNGGKPGVSAAP